MELERRSEELELERVLDHYYSSGRYYNRLSLINLNFSLEEEVKEKARMAGTIKISSEMATELYGCVVGEIFKNFEGKTVGDDFSMSDVMKYFELDESYFEKEKEKEEMEGGGGVKKGKKEKKEKKSRGPSGYQLFQKKNKGEISKVFEEKKESSDSEIKYLSVVSIMWAEVSSEEKAKYNAEAQSMKEEAMEKGDESM